MRRINILRCKNCNHTFIPAKKKRKYQCSLCGRKGRIGRAEKDNFQKYTSKDIKIILDMYQEKPMTLQTLEPQPGPKKKPEVAGRPRTQLTSGHIEYFHKRYRQYKEFHPYEEPRQLVVREWLIATDIGRGIADRWATELLRDHKPIC